MIAVVLGTLLTLAGETPRERVRFDADWKFQRQPVLEGPARMGPFQWEWKLANTDNLYLPTLPEDLGPGEWTPTRLGINVLQRRQNGWFRTELGDDPNGADKVLVFESTDEDAAVFLNGKRLHTFIGFGTEFEVPVAPAWRKGGPNTLVVLIKNWAQTGGINGGVHLVLPARKATPPEFSPTYNDEDWRSVRLPHDYVVEGKFDPSGDNSHGSLPKPIGYYRKTFVPPASMRDKRVWLEFDGVYRDSDVYLNGEWLAHQNSGYTGFRVDLTGKLKFDRPNVLAVRVDPHRNEGWWYEGGGIYRHVWLNAAAPVHIAPDGLFVKSEVRGTGATLNVNVTIRNTQPDARPLTLRTRILDPKGRVVATHESRHEAVVGDATRGVEISLSRVALWDISAPNLYRCETTLYDGNRAIDRESTPFGIRSIRWDKDQGFFLNGRPVKLQGTSNHQDHAGVGIAMPDRLMEWRLRQLKAMGANAYRTAHNQVARELLDACDRLGILVLDETRHLGDTTFSKSAPGTKADDLSQLCYQILHDRNHPSVIAWSLYNEEPLQGKEEGANLFLKMRALVDELDGTRLCTGATNDGFEAGIANVTKLYGINYNLGAYDRVRAIHPDLPLFGSETGSAVSTRGIYANDPAQGYVGAYDVNKASFGNTAEEAWTAIATRPWMAGAFVWTGFDYKGEPTPYGWPCINSAFGIFDIAGFPKDTYHYYRAWWSDKPSLHLLPHWNWPGQEGKPIKVWAHSNADEVELFLNGKSLGRKSMPRLSHLEWDVPYEPGILEAVGTRAGRVVVRDRVETTGAPYRLRLSTEHRKLLADHEDVAVVRVEVVDEKGRVVPTADPRVFFTIEGAGQLAGVGNGNPSDHDPDKASDRRAFNGLCMVLVQSNGTTGRIRLTAKADGLRSATLTLTAHTSSP